MISILRKNWLVLLLVATAVVTVADTSGFLTAPGLWFRDHRAPEMVIAAVFFLSGIALDVGQVGRGLRDVAATVAALLVIFVAAPAVAVLIGSLPMDGELRIGLFLVAVVPPTLTSGVVMTAAAGGSMAHALVTTILANSLAVVTVPFSLKILLPLAGEKTAEQVAVAPVIAQIALLVLLPLAAGLLAGSRAPRVTAGLKPWSATLSQVGIVAVVWMGLSGGRETIVQNGEAVFGVLLVALTFHLVLVATATGVARLCGLGPGRRESVVFVGGQKTLPLSVILQVSLFPQYGLALVVCIVHHLVQLITDAFLIRFFRSGP